MTDLLLHNLRTIGTHHCDASVGIEAADEIERLRAELDAFRASSVIRGENVLRLEASNARMRAYIERVAECPCCHETQTCVQECTFEKDDWHEWDAMMAAREALYGRTQGKPT